MNHSIFSRPPKPRKRRKPQLTSIENLLNEVKEAEHAGLSQIFRDHSFVGCVNEQYALIQHKTKLYLCDCYALRQNLSIIRIRSNIVLSFSFSLVHIFVPPKN